MFCTQEIGAGFIVLLLNPVNIRCHDEARRKSIAALAMDFRIEVDRAEIEFFRRIVILLQERAGSKRFCGL